MESMFHRFSAVLSADIRRELLKFVESPIDNKKSLPELIIFSFVTLRCPPITISSIVSGAMKPRRIF